MAKHDDGIMALVYAMATPCVQAAKELDAALAEAAALAEVAGMGTDPEKLHREAEILARSTTMSTVEAVDHVARRCYDAEFWGAADCMNTACPYHIEDGPMKCEAAEGCPGREETEVGGHD